MLGHSGLKSYIGTSTIRCKLLTLWYTGIRVYGSLWLKLNYVLFRMKWPGMKLAVSVNCYK